MDIQGGPADSFEPTGFANLAANAGIEAMCAWLAERGAKPRHIFIVLDIDPKTMGAEENATIAGRGYDGPEELFNELLDHARSVGEDLGIRVQILAWPAGVGGQG